MSASLYKILKYEGKYALLYALHRAVYDGDAREVRRSLRLRGLIDVNDVDPKLGVTPLMVAAFVGREDMVELLLNKEGIDANKVGRNSVSLVSPLFLAVQGPNSIENILA